MRKSTGRRRATPIEFGLYVQLPLILVGTLVWLASRKSGFDFLIFRRAGLDVLHGRTPYVAPTVQLLSQNTHFVYPQPIAYLFAPFALVSGTTGAVVFLTVSAAASSVALRLFEIRDWRLYGVALLGAPLASAFVLGTIGPLLLLAAAVGWRKRDSPWSGVLLALDAAAKLFPWPLLVWLVVTRRFRAAAAAAATIAVLLAVWAAADPASLGRYPRMLRALELGHPSSYSPRSFWISLGLPGAAAVPVVLAVLGVGVIFVLARDDRASFAAAVVVALLASPIVWFHYLILMAIPLALYRPRLAWPWLIPIGLWFMPDNGPNGSAWRIAVALAAIAATVLAVTPRRAVLGGSQPRQMLDGWVVPVRHRLHAVLERR